jgi:hypothetical protein
MFEAPQTLTIRTQSTGVKIRAGLVLGTARAWAEHEIQCTVDGFKKLLALTLEPGVKVHGKDEDGNWLPLPAPDVIQAGIGRLEAAQDAESAQDAINTVLPTAEPTLERDPSTPAPDTPDAKADDKSQDEPQA